MNRRGFIKALGAALVMPKTTYFLPPPGGWTRAKSGLLVPGVQVIGRGKGIWDERTIAEHTKALDLVWGMIGNTGLSQFLDPEKDVMFRPDKVRRRR